jgi:membrane protein YqaA with SNARE-associated domain
VRRFGAPGIFGFVVAAETSPLPPLAGEPALYLALKGGMPFWTVALLGCAGNLVAAALCYPGGLLLRRLGLTDRLLGNKKAEAEAQVRRHGAWALVISCFTPLPFATLAWSAAALGIPARHYALACLARVPKVMLYLWILDVGR